MIIQTSPGNNTYKLGEVLAIGSTFKLLQLLMGFPTYPALVATLGLGGLGTSILTKEQHCHILTT